MVCCVVAYHRILERSLCTQTIRFQPSRKLHPRMRPTSTTPSISTPHKKTQPPFWRSLTHPQPFLWHSNLPPLLTSCLYASLLSSVLHVSMVQPSLCVSGREWPANSKFLSLILFTVSSSSSIAVVTVIHCSCTGGLRMDSLQMLRDICSGKTGQIKLMPTGSRDKHTHQTWMTVGTLFWTASSDWDMLRRRMFYFHTTLKTPIRVCILPPVMLRVEIAVLL